jgi:hypothetical protein
MRPGWRLGDARLEADALDFWKRMGNLPEGVSPEARARELVVGCYKDDVLIGVQTATIVRLDFVRARFLMLRSAVDPEARRGHASSTMSYYTRDHLEAWAAEHPEENIAGIAAIMESRQLTELQREPIWPRTGLAIAGFTPDGRQIRISWFNEIRPGWRRGDSGLEADAIAFWNRLGNLPPDVVPEVRAKELVCGCYKDGILIGVQTAEIVRLDFLRASFALIRASVDPAARRGHASSTMAYYTRNFLDLWSAANPGERLAGIAAILESDELAELQREPFWPETALTVVGYTLEDRQIRISWFPHYRMD